MKASEGIAQIDAAVAHGRRAIDSARDLFSGTVPPKPWPSPELYDAMEKAADARDRLDVFVRHGDPDFNAQTPQVARVVAEVKARVAAVELEANRLEARRDLVSTHTVTNAVAKVKAVATTPKIVPFLLLGYLGWQAVKKPRRRS